VLILPCGEMSFDRVFFRRLLRAGLVFYVRRLLDEKYPIVKGSGEREIFFEHAVRFANENYGRIIIDRSWDDASDKWRHVAGLMRDGEKVDDRPCLFFMLSRIHVGPLRWLAERGRHYLMRPTYQVDSLDLRIMLDYLEERGGSWIYHCRKEPSGLYADEPAVFDDVLRMGIYAVLLSFVEVFGDADGVLELPSPVDIFGERSVVRIVRQDDPLSFVQAFNLSVESFEETAAYEMDGRTLSIDDLVRIVTYLDGYYVKDGAGFFWGEI